MRIRRQQFTKYINKKSINLLIIGFFIGVVITLIFVVVDKLILERKKEANNNRTNKEGVIAPYYDKSAFSLPQDLEKSKEAASSTESAKPVVKLPIIMYHYIEYVKDQGDLIRKKLDITPANFEAQLKSLKEANYITYFVKDVPKLLVDKNMRSGKDVILTFDDGYEDFYTDALPILKKYQMKATIYIVNHFIDKKGYLNKSQIREIIDSGLVEIGSHTLDHAYLKKSPVSFAKKEIFESKKGIEDEFGITVETFAYPYGAFTKEVTEMVREASFSAAVSVIPGVFQSEDNLFFLFRIRPGMFVGSSTAKILDGLKQ